MVVPPQNPVDRTIVDVCGLGVRLAYPDTSLAVRPARDRQITTKRLPHVEPSATYARVRALSAWSLSRSSQLTSPGGPRFEERSRGICPRSRQSHPAHVNGSSKAGPARTRPRPFARSASGSVERSAVATSAGGSSHSVSTTSACASRSRTSTRSAPRGSGCATPPRPWQELNLESRS